MTNPVKLAGFVLALVLVFVAGLLSGQVVRAGNGPDRDAHAGGHNEAAKAGGHDSASHDHGSGDHHGDTGQAKDAKAAPLPNGLMVTQDGYTLRPERTVVSVGKTAPFRFSVVGPDGRPVRQYTVNHDKELHLIVVRRDLTGYQHLHPTRSADGTWAVPLAVPEPGAYRAFADFTPAGGAGLTLGVDLAAPGSFAPAPLPAASRSTTVDGYTVNLEGDLKPGKSSLLTMAISRGGKPVTDLQPYLGAAGHLVALRAGDLAYLHVHPEAAADGGKTAVGPKVNFHVEVPSSGSYRLFFDFRHADAVRTAALTVSGG